MPFPICPPYWYGFKRPEGKNPGFCGHPAPPSTQPHTLTTYQQSPRSRAPGRFLVSWPELPSLVRSAAVPLFSPLLLHILDALAQQCSGPVSFPLCLPGNHLCMFYVLYKQSLSQLPSPSWARALPLDSCVALWLRSSFCDLRRPGTVSPLSGLYCQT